MTSIEIEEKKIVDEKDMMDDLSHALETIHAILQLIDKQTGLNVESLNPSVRAFVKWRFGYNPQSLKEFTPPQFSMIKYASTKLHQMFQETQIHRDLARTLTYLTFDVEPPPTSAEHYDEEDEINDIGARYLMQILRMFDEVSEMDEEPSRIINEWRNGNVPPVDYYQVALSLAKRLNDKRKKGKKE